MMGAPVTVVTGTVVIIEPPEHGVELSDTAGGALVGVGGPGGRAEPHIPIHIGVGGGFCFDGLCFSSGPVPLAEEAVGMRGAAQVGGEVGDIFVVLSGGVAIVAVDPLYIADESVTDDHTGGAEFPPGTLHGTGLENALVLFLRLHDELSFFNGEGQGFFAIHIFAILHGFDGNVGVPVVGGGNADRINGGIGDHIPEIGNGLALGKFGLFVFFVVVVDELGARFAADTVAVTNGLDDDSILLNEMGDQNGTGLNTVTDKTHVHFLFSRFCGRLFSAFTCHKSLPPSRCVLFLTVVFKHITPMKCSIYPNKINSLANAFSLFLQFFRLVKWVKKKYIQYSNDFIPEKQVQFNGKSQ